MLNYIKIPKKEFLKGIKGCPDNPYFDIWCHNIPLGVNTWVAGGLIRRFVSTTSEEPSDIDIFTNSEESYKEIYNNLQQKFYYLKTSTSDRELNTTIKVDGYTVSAPDENSEDKHIPSRTIQLIKLYHNSPEECLDSFDYTICQLAYDGTDFIVHWRALVDITRKQLGFNKLSYGVSSLRRSLKYSKKGYTIPPSTFQGILESVIDTPEAINPEIISVD